MIECTIDGYRERIAQLRKKGAAPFFKFFDGGSTPDIAFSKAEDIFIRMMLPWAKKRGTCLDLGYGGGCQLFTSAKYFNHSYGLDVHNEYDYVCDELLKRGVNNFTLIRGDGSSIPLPNNHVDFVYSWVTLMHVGTIDIVKKYLKEMYRVMKRGAVGVLYFARLLKTGNTLSDWRFDIEYEGSFQELIGEEVNQINLRIGMKFFESLCEDAGFTVMFRTVSRDSSSLICGGQHGVIINK